MDAEYRLPPDFVLTRSVAPLTEVLDWSLAFLGIPQAWKQSRGSGVKVCILDTGCDLKHPDLEGAILDARDFTRSVWGPEDRVGHGTWCAGMVGARAGNDKGVGGIAPECKLLIGKVLGDRGSGSDATIEAGLKWAIDQDADIVSMSLGGPAMGERLHALVRAFVARKGKFLIAAAGNDGRPNSINYPAKWLECVSVVAVGKDGELTKFSSRGERSDIAAPGDRMISCIPDGYGEMSGTSMACPVVAGVSALAVAKHRAVGGSTGLETVQDLREHLRRTASDESTPVPEGEFRFKLIRPGKFLDAIGTQAPPAAPNPPPAGDGGVWVWVPGGRVAA